MGRAAAAEASMVLSGSDAEATLQRTDTKYSPAACACTIWRFALQNLHAHLAGEYIEQQVPVTKL